jgi:hypothetical protein
LDCGLGLDKKERQSPIEDHAIPGLFSTETHF